MTSMLHGGLGCCSLLPRRSCEQVRGDRLWRCVQCCDTGGTMQPSTNFAEGKTSRSLKAAFLVLRESLAPGVAHLDGGIVAWCVCPAGLACHIFFGSWWCTREQRSLHIA